MDTTVIKSFNVIHSMLTCTSCSSFFFDLDQSLAAVESVGLCVRAYVWVRVCGCDSSAVFYSIDPVTLTGPIHLSLPTC